jgi:hypothetical protein
MQAATSCSLSILDPRHSIGIDIVSCSLSHDSLLDRGRWHSNCPFARAQFQDGTSRDT